MDALEQLSAVTANLSRLDTNEANTRHKIIDHVLHELLGWPKNRVDLEEFIAPGFADYVLRKPNGDDLLLIEAKRAGEFFELPIAASETQLSSYIAVKKLITDEAVRRAMEQVRAYCINTGCEFACISNGFEWIFFKTFEKGKRWENLQAFVVRSPDFFIAEYTKAINSLSFTAITEKSSLQSLLSSASPKDRGVYFPKEKIASYSHQIPANKLAAKLRPIAQRFFGVIDDSDTEFMDRCYVSQRAYQGTSDGMRALIRDSLSPYFESFGVQQLEDTGKGGRLGGRLTKHLKQGRRGEVLVLFGGKGSGKSTFLKRLLHHNPPKWLIDHSAVAIIDLLQIPESREDIRRVIWEGLVQRLDVWGFLNADRNMLLTELFRDRFDLAKRQDLSGLSPSSEAYNVRLNALVAEWKQDLQYCAVKLVERLHNEGKGAIVVIDNTDQYSSEIQDFCFTSAQEIGALVQSVTLISMREERFFDSKIRGVLDAFQNSGFHISSPKPAEVFRKRLDFAIQRLEKGLQVNGIPYPSGDAVVVLQCANYLKILNREFSNDLSPLNRFLTASAHGDIRLSLDLFKSFLLSGYTNVEEMLASGSWVFQIHQVIRPVMTPSRFFYSEHLSEIPNIFQLRSIRHSSHFTSLRILRKLAKGGDPTAPSYYSVAELRSYFSETFNMVDDFEKCLDVLLKHGFIEADNRLDHFSDQVDNVKITSYGYYMLNELAYDFTYLDLVSTDCGVFSEQTSNYLTEAARKEFYYFSKRDRAQRVRVRIDRVGTFIKYLREEELRDREQYSLGMPESEMFSTKAITVYETENKRVLESMKRQPHLSAHRKTHQ